eukprot:scaffold227_cov165-Amphora_coffeaeformis.AAC.33
MNGGWKKAREQVKLPGNGDRLRSLYVASRRVPRKRKNFSREFGGASPERDLLGVVSVGCQAEDVVFYIPFSLFGEGPVLLSRFVVLVSLHRLSPRSDHDDRNHTQQQRAQSFADPRTIVLTGFCGRGDGQTLIPRPSARVADYYHSASAVFLLFFYCSTTTIPYNTILESVCDNSWGNIHVQT